MFFCDYSLIGRTLKGIELGAEYNIGVIVCHGDFAGSIGPSAMSAITNGLVGEHIEPNFDEANG